MMKKSKIYRFFQTSVEIDRKVEVRKGKEKFYRGPESEVLISRISRYFHVTLASSIKVP